MTAGLETFAKVRRLHDATTHRGEKASAAARMKTLARKAGMTVAEAVSKLDAPKPQTRAEAMAAAFNDIFNTPEMRAERAERERRRAQRRAVALAEYGSEDAVWAETEWETALAKALRLLIVRKPIIGGDMDTLQGWDGGRFDRMPGAVQAAVAVAYPSPGSVREAWAEYRSWGRLADDRIAFFPDYDHDVRVRARTAFVENLLDTMPARSMNDLRARLDWMGHMNGLEWNRGNPEDGILLATLRADIERMGQRIREQDAAPVQSGQAKGSAQSADPSLSHCETTTEISTGRGSRSATPSPAKGGGETPPPLRRTNADKRRDVLVLLNADDPGIAGLTDREIARRAGVSPTTVGTIRRKSA